MKKSKYLLLIISICTLCLILAGCAVNAKYTATASKDVKVGSFAFHDAEHVDTDNDSQCDICKKQLCEHEWLDATCTEPKTCEKCGATQGEATGHTSVTDAAVDPTCTETGLTEGSHCSKCGEVFVEQQIIEALGHKEETLPAVDATCTSTGLTEGKECSVCGVTTVEQQETEKLAHSYTDEWVVGDTRHWHKCANCDSTSDTADHKYVYMSDGDDTHTGVCECSKQTESDCTGGTATCTDKPVCETCNTAYGTALGHTSVTDAAVAPTCTDTGLTEGSHCSVCGVTIVAQAVVDALGHDEETLPAVDATCTDTGLTEGKECSVCGVTTVEQTSVKALGHQMTAQTDNHLASAATCTDNAKYYYSCSRCGEVDANTYEKANTALDHDMTNKNTDGKYLKTAATCEDKAVYYYSCSRCGAQSTSTFESGTPKGHTMANNIVSDNIVSAATCTADAVYYQSCSTCGARSSTQFTATGTKLNHTPNNGTVTTAATCISEGTKTYNCTVCGTVTSTQTIAKTEHVYADAWTYDNSQHWRKCTNTSCTSTTTKIDHSFSYKTNNDNTNHTGSCTCGKTVVEACSGDKGSTKNCVTKATCTKCGSKYGSVSTTHSWESTYSSDASNHWYACKVSGCTATNGKTGHTASSTWSTDNYNHWKECTKCGYDTNKEAHNSNTYGGTEGVHRKCSVCSKTMQNGNSHSYTTSTVTAATCTTTGQQKHTCSCGYSYTSTISAIGHSWTMSHTASNTSFTCARGCTLSADKFISANEIKTSTKYGAAFGDVIYDSNSLGNGYFVLLNTPECGSACSYLEAGGNQYAVVIYGFERGYLQTGGSQFAIQVGVNKIDVTNTFVLSKAGAGVLRSEILNLGSAADNLCLFANVNVTEILIWGVAMFDNAADAEAYQDALAKSTIAGVNILDSGYAS